MDRHYQGSMKAASNMEVNMIWTIMCMYGHALIHYGNAGYILYVLYMQIFGYVKQNCDKAITQMPPIGAQPFKSRADNKIISS